MKKSITYEQFIEDTFNDEAEVFITAIDMTSGQVERLLLAAVVPHKGKITHYALSAVLWPNVVLSGEGIKNGVLKNCGVVMDVMGEQNDLPTMVSVNN